MRRALPLAAFLLSLALIPVSAQRAGGHVGGFAARGMMGHSAGAYFSGIHVGSGRPGFFRGLHEGVFRGGFHRGFNHHFGFRRFGYPGYGYTPYYGYYSPFWWDSFYSDDYRFDEQQAREIEMANEMDRLNLEEQRLRVRNEAWNSRREQDANSPERPLHSEMTPPPVPTVLVFRDHHQQEIQNYAISGNMLWVLNAQSAKKIPLTQLDLEATQKINDERGVEFAVPR